MGLNAQTELKTTSCRSNEDELLASLSGQLTRVLMFYFRNWNLRCDLCDLVQETYLRVISQVRRGISIHTLEAYVYKTAEFVAREQYRHERSRKPAESLELMELPDKKEDPESALLRKELIQNCLEAIRRLPPKHRAILIRVIGNEEDRAHVCREFGMSRNALRILLHHAVRKVQNDH